MPKNIILCADGTGNRGGETPDTNVYRIYNAIERHRPRRLRRQITYYDNGVGTDGNRYWRAVTGALGFGFAENVRQMYAFLARHYEPGDIVYLFGFSRGAATVRAFAGMLQACGLLDRRDPCCGEAGQFDEERFAAMVNLAFEHYRAKCGDDFAHRYGTVDARIKFMGIWDTVSALGFPYQRYGDSLIDDLLERPLPVWIARLCDRLLDFGPLAHRFYNFAPGKVVDHVYHALALDDARKSFLPRIWDENDPWLLGRISQVWFAGMHADVGGGYRQPGLAYESLAWMMERAEHHGLDFRSGALQDAKDRANAHGLMHDSRAGVAAYYRYAPRRIAELCQNRRRGPASKIDGPVQIHRSVIDRMIMATDQYAPGFLPADLCIVDTPLANKNGSLPAAHGLDATAYNDHHAVNSTVIPLKSSSSSMSWASEGQQLGRLVRAQQWLYRLFADFSFLVAACALALWLTEDDSWFTDIARYLPDPGLPAWIVGGIEDGLRYVTPAALDDFIDLAWVGNPAVLLGVVGVFLLLLAIRALLSQAARTVRIAIRERILCQPEIRRYAIESRGCTLAGHAGGTPSAGAGRAEAAPASSRQPELEHG